MRATKNSNTVYPRQPKPGIKQLGKLDKEKRERDAKVTLFNTRLEHICRTFARHPLRTGGISITSFDFDYVPFAAPPAETKNIHATPSFVIAVAAIYCNIHAEYDRLNEVILFVRNKDEQISAPATPLIARN